MGVNDSTKRKLIKVCLKTQKVDVVCLQETKWKSGSRMLIRSLVPSRFVDWVASCSEGASGTIVIMWDTRVVQLVGHEESSNILSCRFRSCRDDFFWGFIGIYGPIKSKLREDLWEDLGL